MKKKKILGFTKISVAILRNPHNIKGGSIQGTNTNPHSNNCTVADCDNTAAPSMGPEISCEIACNPTNNTRPQSQHCNSVNCASQLETLNCD